MTLLKKGDPKRRWRSFKRHALLLFKTFVFAADITCLWYIVWMCGYHFPEDDKDILIGAVITPLGVMYGLEISWITTSIWEKYQKVVICVLEQDKHAFLSYRDERMPIMFHLLIGAVSFPLLAMIGMIDYKHGLTGAISVFAVSFVLILFWFVRRATREPGRRRVVPGTDTAGLARSGCRQVFRTRRRAQRGRSS